MSPQMLLVNEAPIKSTEVLSLTQREQNPLQHLSDLDCQSTNCDHKYLLMSSHTQKTSIPSRKLIKKGQILKASWSKVKVRKRVHEQHLRVSIFRAYQQRNETRDEKWSLKEANDDVAVKLTIMAKKGTVLFSGRQGKKKKKKMKKKIHICKERSELRDTKGHSLMWGRGRG